MNNISDTASPGLLSNHGNLQNTQFAGQSSKQSVNAYESLDTGLTIKTREGDIVTLSSKSFSELNSFEYNSRGKIQTDSGTAQFSQHLREITLSTGDQFSFSVQGDLNEQELADIEAIVLGVEGIAAEMAEGDMGGAMEKAMAMGSYSSVSMYSADISHQRSYAVRDETRSVASNALPGEGPGEKISQRPKSLDHFVDRMSKFLEKQEDKLLAKSQQPLSSLFEQLLKNIADTDEEDVPVSEVPALETQAEDTQATPASEKQIAGPPAYDTPAHEALKAFGERVDQIINYMLKNAFETTFDGVA